jgi:ferredoxin-NADP reductase
MKARLVESFEVAPETRHFIFEAETELSFAPGQFVSLVAEIGGKELTRAYSIASAPKGKRFDLCLNLVQDGAFSPFLFRMAPGDELEYKGPFGTFVWRKPASDSILVATGTGITPFRAMLQEGLGGRLVTLVLGARHEYGLIYRHEFEEIAARNAHFRFIPTLTRPGESWRGLSGRVHGPVLELLGDRRDVDVYICGMAEMVNELRAKLKEVGLDRKRIIVEKYD